MKTLLFPLCVLFLTLAGLRADPPVVSNVVASQRAGTKLVDITYDLTASTGTVTISVQLSGDGGVTYTLPAVTLSGAVGAGVAPGTGKRIVWDAGTDWNGQLVQNCQVRVAANDGTTQAPPPGMAYIQAGPFQMGDNFAEGSTAELPVHNVQVSAFAMDVNLVTGALWASVQQWGAGNGYDCATGSWKATSHPVQAISWYDAVKWCNARSQKEGLTPCYYTDATQATVYKTGQLNLQDAWVKWTANGYRLPTEAEWEKAARGGQVGLRFPWGNTISHANANFYNNGGESYATGTGGYDPTWGTGAQPYTSPVGSFAANGYGLYDMAGNVFEWCWDWYGVYYGSPGAGTDPHGLPSGSYRVLRGGSWATGAYECRAAFRGNDSPGKTYDYFGFRPVRR